MNCSSFMLFYTMFFLPGFGERRQQESNHSKSSLSDHPFEESLNIFCMLVVLTVSFLPVKMGPHPNCNILNCV